jgi:hypothetical protein
MRVQDSIRDTFASIVRVALLSGNTVQVVLGTSPVEVSHGLNRNIEGWIIIRKNAQADVWEPSVSVTPEKTLPLQASAAVTVTIYFF